METDRILVKKVLSGDIQSFETVVNKFYNKLVSFACKLDIPRDDAEDMAQEVFIKAYNNLYRYSEKWEFSTWLFKIAVNHCKDYKKKRKLKFSEFTDMEISGLKMEEHVDKLHMRQILKKMLGFVDKDAKAMLILHYSNGFSLKEIGKMYEMTPEAVKMKMFRARSKLAKSFGDTLMGGDLL